jgi:hypothetical protein
MLGRKINFFEKMLLPVGIGVTFFGFYLILLADNANSLLAWFRVSTVFIWMLLLFNIIITATSEDMKEELSLIQKEHITEIKLLRELVHDQLQEVKLLRQEMSKKHK